MAVASLFLDFLRLLPSQVLLLNVLADLPMPAVSTDTVSDDEVTTPRRWDVRRIMGLSVYLGIVNAFGAFGLLRFLRGEPEAVVQTGWFPYLGLTALLVMFIVGTRDWVWRAPTLSRPLLAALGVAFGHHPGSANPSSLADLVRVGAAHIRPVLAIAGFALA